MTPTKWGVAAIVGVGLAIITAHEVWAWLAIRKLRREEEQRFAAWKARPRGGPLDGVGLITDEDEEILAGIEEASNGRPGQ